jgi:hypothetical protein
MTTANKFKELARSVAPQVLQHLMDIARRGRGRPAAKAAEIVRRYGHRAKGGQ